MNIIGAGRRQFRPPHNVILQVEITNFSTYDRVDYSRYYNTYRYVNIHNFFRALTWYHNGNKLTSNERITLSSDNTTLTVANSTVEDSGVYEVRFDGLLIHPYSRTCEEAVLNLLRHYPVFKTAVFHLGTTSTGKPLEVMTKEVCSMYCIGPKVIVAIHKWLLQEVIHASQQIIFFSLVLLNSIKFCYSLSD